MIVDDEPRLREVLMRSTRASGFRVFGARSAEHARRMLQQESIDIIVLDLNLPGLDGLQFLEQLHRQKAQVQVIILTGFGSLDAARKAIHLDVVDFLTKPCALGDLEIAIDRACRRLAGELPAPISNDPVVAPQATLDELERVHILAALDRHNGNRAAVAAELGISERTLYYRLANYAKR
jgi:DNA-binding NtrC family response regulator